MPSKVREVTSFEYETLADFRYALRLFFKFSEGEAGKLGLTPRQHQALLAIKGVAGKGLAINIKLLAERLQIEHHSAVGLINRLIKLKLVIRKVSSSDRRNVELVLTDQGSHLLEKLTGAHRDELRRIGPQLTRLLKKIQK